MATLYFVIPSGTSGVWDASTTTNWASSSGGAGGVAAPTTADDVVFDASSGPAGMQIVTSGAMACHNITCTGIPSNAVFGNGGGLSITGDMILSTNISSINFASGITLSPAAGATITLDTKNVNINLNNGGQNFLISGGGPVATRTINLASTFRINGTLRFSTASTTFNSNGFDMNTPAFQWNLCGSTFTLNLGASNLTVTNGSFEASLTSVFNAGTSTITFTTATATFNGGQQTYNNVIFNVSAAINTRNTFNTFTCTTGKTYTFSSGVVQTMTTLNAIGTSGSHIVFTKSSVSNASLCVTTSNLLYVNSTGITASCSTLNSPGGVDGGGNVGWNFTDPYFIDIVPDINGDFMLEDWNLPGGEFLPGDIGLDDTCVNITGTFLDCTGLVEVGVVYSNTNSTPTIYDYIQVFTCSIGNFSLSICGLIPGNVYTFGIYTRSGTGLIRYYNYRSVRINARIKKKRYYYKVYGGTSLQYVTTWSTDVISDPAFRMVLNGGAGELVVRLGRPYGDYGEGDDVTANNRVELWCQDRDNSQGVKIYTGYISAYSPVIDGEDQYVDVTVLGYATRLAVHNLKDAASGQTSITYSSFEPAEILRDVIDKYHEDGGTDVFYTVDSILNTNSVASYEFINNTIQEAVDKVIELTPENWFWYIDANGIIFLQPANIARADHRLTVGKDVSYVESNKRIENLVNAVTIVGGGSPTPLYNSYTRPASIALYGKWEKRIQDGRVTLDSTSDLMAKRILDRQDTPEFRTVVRITDNNGQNQLQGLDIENIFPGDTLQLININNAPILIIQSVSYTPYYIEVEAATRLPEISKDLTYLNRNLTTTNQTPLPSTPATRMV